MPISRALSRLGLLALPLASALLPCVASAHINLEAAGTHRSRYGVEDGDGDGDADIKDGPCGRTGGTRGTNVYTYKPGETITIKLREDIAHPSYFRIAFDADGDDDFIEPASIKPIDPMRPCPYDANDKCGKTDDFNDFFNSPAVLMDNLNPHMSNGMQTYTWEVKLPDVECTNCTLQIIQVMQDLVHGAYSPKGASNELFYIEDIYHTCIDLVLEKDATGGGNPPPPPVVDAGVDDEDAGGASGGTSGNGGDNGAGSTSANNGGGAGNGATPPGGGSSTGTTGGDKGSGATGSSDTNTGGSMSGSSGSCSVAVSARATEPTWASWLCGSAFALMLWTRRRSATPRAR